MIRTVILECTLPANKANTLNAESSRIYNRTMAAYYRGPQGNPDRSIEEPETPIGVNGPSQLHGSSRRAARQAFYDAVRSARKSQRQGVLKGMPQRRSTYRTTIWRGPAVKVRDNTLQLARAWSLSAIHVPLPPDLAQLPASQFREVRLVWNDAMQRHYWQLVVDEPRQELFGARVAAVDLGSAYPATVTDGDIAVVFEVSQLKSLQKVTDKQVGRLRHDMEDKNRRSREYRHLQRRERRLRNYQARVAHPIERLVSEAVVQWAVQNGVGTLVVGDADHLAREGVLPPAKPGKSGESIQTRIMRYLAALAGKLGIIVKFIDEALTSQICPGCRHRNRANGRHYKCTTCGFHGHRDAVGSSNLLSRYLYGDLGQIWPRETQFYRPGELDLHNPVHRQPMARAAA